MARGKIPGIDAKLAKRGKDYWDLKDQQRLSFISVLCGYA